MCLITKTYATKEKAKAAKLSKNRAIAPTDLLVYKRLTKTNHSPFQSTHYKKGEIVESPFSFRPIYNKLRVYKGLHAYTSKKAAINARCKNEKIVQMMIPRGSQYYVSACGEKIVANKLIW